MMTPNIGREKGSSFLSPLILFTVKRQRDFRQKSDKRGLLPAPKPPFWRK
jgi:hypothetical protein